MTSPNDMPQDEQIHIISLGAGVQSSTMALMAVHGEISPTPAFAVFADTGDEPAEVYTWLDWLTKQLTFPVLRQRHQAGRLSDALLDGYEMARIPAFYRRKRGGFGMVQRQCTRNFKLRVIRQGVRRGLGIGARTRIAPRSIVQWIGISIDEADRMKPSDVRFSINRHPLIELNVSRDDCKQWMLRNYGRIPPKSSCVQCPYKSDEQWLELKRHATVDFDRACEIDEGLRDSARVRQFHGRELYLHRSCIPLRIVPLDAAMNHDLFSNECAGVCRV